ncbi:major facilitator superfamily domain-containing protein [Trichoderma breve]|uniref:Major facilitator superfamily domain-containing protein n=1 Tax=Trichoderma breve TaxID=2034170 RepID=A0A9W9BEI7_9HYPO|nr:major facilitator superfamily domain-containing protein [Trichoderma breve]KAJ4858116.1 major facilitator superfamily domain-containing protein [Trichoderma breve]
MSSTLTETVADSASSHGRFAQDDISLTQRSRHATSEAEEEAATPPAEPSATKSSNRQTIIITIASFTIVFTCCGINFAFGIFQAVFETLSQQPDTPFTGASPADIDLIGTLSISLMTIGAPFVVAWSKRFSPKLISLIGSTIFSAALILASFGKSLWHFEVTQGVLLGLGTCMSYMVAVTIAPTWFTTRRGLGLGIITSGTGIGGLVWAPALKAAVDSMGYRNAMRLAGGIAFGLNVLASAAMAWEPEAKARIDMENAARTSRMDGILKVPIVDWRIARTLYYLPLFFFATYARTLGYSDTAGANFIALSNACNAIGKIAIGYAADHMGRLNALGLFISFTILYGIFASAYVALFPASLVELFGVHNFASVNGVLYMVRGLASLVGTPVGGVLIRSHSTGSPARSYEGMTVLTSVLLFAASISVIWVRMEAMIGVDGKLVKKWKM